MLDQPKAVRPGEELDAAKIVSFLEAKLGTRQPLEIKQFPSGFSNLTYSLHYGDRDLVLRRPPFGANIKSGHDMEREFRVLSLLEPVFGKVPQPIAYTADLEIIGAPFYIMERVKGVILRGQPPKGLTVNTETMRRLSGMLVDTLVEIHAIDVEKTGLLQMGKPGGYVQRQVEGWTKRYQAAQTDQVPHMEHVAAWLAANRPPERYTGFIHNDFKYDNAVFNESLTGITAILDWEMATVGDPLMDLGTSLGYWIEANDPPIMRTFNLTHLPGNLTRQEVVRRYAEKSGRDVDNALFYFVFGSYKIGVIIQQIYARYRQGLTQDPRFAMLGEALQACAQMAATAIEKNRI